MGIKQTCFVKKKILKAKNFPLKSFVYFFSWNSSWKINIFVLDQDLNRNDMFMLKQ